MSIPVSIVPIDPSLSNKQWAAAATTEKSKVGTTRIFYGDKITALTSLGEGFADKKGDVRREIVRKAVGSAVKQVKDLGEDIKDVEIDASTDPHAAGERSF